MNSASSPSRERKKAENGYIPEGVMQFMATVDDVTDDGYVIVKTDTQSERFPQIRKDVRYRLSMEAYDPGIYNDKLVPGNVVIVAGKEASLRAKVLYNANNLSDIGIYPA